MADKNNEDTTINLDALSQGTADEVSEVNDVMGNSDGQTAQPERVTFEQWLEAQTNLTPEQRQALLDHNADAAVTFSPEAFDGYLAELRSADVADSAPANDRPSEKHPRRKMSKIRKMPMLRHSRKTRKMKPFPKKNIGQP